MASTIKLTESDILNIPYYVRTLKAQAWRLERAYKKEKVTCWFMSEINSILRTAAASIFRPARLLHFPIIASTSHFFHTSSPRLGITGMQFPVNNIPRHESALLRRIHSFFFAPTSPSFPLTLSSTPTSSSSILFFAYMWTHLLIPLSLFELFRLIMKRVKSLILVSFQ